VTRLALVTWRLPQADLPRLERVRERLSHLAEAAEVFTFATCQRCLACTTAEEPRQAAEGLAETIGLAGGERHTGVDALAHLARVAASLDALVPGEDQVPAQFRQALDEAADELPPDLHERLQRARAIARQARDAGDLTGHESRSILALAAPLLPDEGPLGVVGTGTIARELVETSSGARELHVVSRQRDRARELAGDGARAWAREAFLADPPALAGLVLCTRSTEGPVLTEARARALDRARPASDPLPVVDLGVPRNAEPNLATDPRLQVSTLADLARRKAADVDPDPQIEKARRALEQALERERRKRRTADLDERVVALREHLAQDLARLTEDLEGPPEEALEAWIDQAHGRLAHTSQRHLEAALRGEAPP